jgi:urease accessory protein UreE
MKKEQMSTIDKIKKLLTLSKSAKSHKVVFYKEAILDDGRTIVTESEEWVSGVEIRVLSEDGTAIVLEAGSYALEDGTELVIDENSALVSIGMEEEEVVEVEAQEEGEEDKEIKDAVADETGEAVAEAVASPEMVDIVAEAINEATGDEVTPEIAKEAAVAAVGSIEAEIPAVTEEVKEELSEVETFSAVANMIEDKFSELETRLSKLEDSPASEGLTHTPESLFKKEEVNNKVSLSSQERARKIINSFN